MEAGLGRPDRDAEHVGDPRERQVEVEMQDHDGAGLRLQSSEDPVQLIAVGDQGGAVERGEVVDRGDLDLDDAPSTLAAEIDAGVGDQAVEPVIEGPWIAQPRQAAPRPDERLLDGILGEIRIAKDETSRGIQARAGRADELGEGLPVAFPCSNHEPLLVHDRLGCRRDSAAAFEAYGAGTGPEGSHFPDARRGIVTAHCRE